jgi:prepilin-type processing-associated H-X9-DG protein
MTQSWSARACLAFGLLALLFYLATLADVPNHLLPKSISRAVEERRRQNGYLTSTGAALIALMAAFVSRMANTRVRAVGLLSASVALALMFFQAVHTIEHTPARRAQCVNNLKQISLALLNYESVYGVFPPRVIQDPRGRPLLSWRVAILPFLEQEHDLYGKFHLDEPWDSPHNLSLIDQMPGGYFCPGQPDWTRNLTIYQVLDGPGVFLDSMRPTRISEITDDFAKTIAVVEGRIPIPWTSPQDVPFQPDQPFLPWEATHPGGFNATFVDGSVRFHSRTMSEPALKAFATRSGGEK